MFACCPHPSIFGRVAELLSIICMVLLRVLYYGFLLIFGKFLTGNLVIILATLLPINNATIVVDILKVLFLLSSV